MVLVWLVCMAGGPSRTPATCQGRGPPNRPPPAPPGGRRVGLWCFGMGFGGFSRLFTRGPSAFLSFLFCFCFCFSGVLWLLAFFAFDSPSKRGTSRWLGPSAEAGNTNINTMGPTHGQRGKHGQHGRHGPRRGPGHAERTRAATDAAHMGMHNVHA